MTAALVESNQPARSAIRDMLEIAELAPLSGATETQVAEWHRQGFLPAPERARDGRRGRGPYRFPSTALAACSALVRWRRYVDGPDAVRVWLWLEGFDYIAVDPVQLDRDLADWRRETWLTLKAKLPSLPDLGKRPPTDEMEERLLEEIEQEYTSEFQKQGNAVAQIGAATILSMLGLVSDEDVALWHEVGLRDRRYGQRDSAGLAQAFLDYMRQTLDRFVLPPFALSSDIDLAISRQALPQLALGPAVEKSTDWPVVRRIWQVFSQITDQ